jgi:hypothetical protein
LTADQLGRGNARDLNAFTQQIAVTLWLHFRNPMALLYGYVFPLLFLAAFWALYRHEPVPLIRHLGELLTVTILGGACFGLPTALVNDRERSVGLRYQLTPIAPRIIIAATLVARFILLLTAGLLQLAVALAVGMSMPEDPFALLVSFTIVSFAFMALGLVIAAMADSVVSVQALGQCIFLPLLILGGVAIPIASLPDWAQALSRYLPGRYAVTSLQGAAEGAGFASARSDLLALLLIGVAAGFAGLKLFRWSPGQSFRTLPGKRWLIVAAGVWVVSGVVGQFRTPPMPANVSQSTAVPATPRSSEIHHVQSPPQPWELLSDHDLASIDFTVPPDAGRVTPIAAAEETPDDDTDLVLAKLEGELPHWAPGRVADPVQRVRNLLSVAAVVDLMQQPVERYVPLLLLKTLESELGRDDAIKLLGWIALHPDQGSIVTDLSALKIEGTASPTAVRERVQLYAIKLLARLTGRSTVAATQ